MIQSSAPIEVNRSNFWIILFIYLSIFINSIVFLREPFEFYFGYLIYIVLLPGFISRYGLNRALFFIFLTLFVTGIINVMLDNNTGALFFKVFTGLFLSYFFYYYVIVEFNYNIDQLFKWYLKGAYIAALIGLVQFISFQIGFTLGYNYRWLLNKWGVVSGGNFGIRVNSIFGEPTHLGAVMGGAFFVALYNLTRKEKYYLTRNQSIIIIVVYVLSFSGLGQAGIFFSLLFLAISYGFIRYIFILIPLAIILFNVLYNNVRDFRERYQSIVDLFTTGKFELGKTHGSSFILYNNYNVALENFKSNFIFGTGIGSHPIAFEKFSLAKEIKVYGFNLNSADANSMLLRLISETGLFGVSIFFIIMFKCYVRRDENNETYHWLVSNAILIMILLNLFRQGHYFLNGFPFFMLLYYFNWISHKKFLEQMELPKEAIKE
ncbi:MAG: hypothetical protein H0W61_08280 [Bacteroidetes bacterium]|nr:hypothetical protein [Bacteroidota bacterium]